MQASVQSLRNSLTYFALFGLGLKTGRQATLCEGSGHRWLGGFLNDEERVWDLQLHENDFRISLV